MGLKKKITEYAVQATTFVNGDMFDVSKLLSTGPDVWESQKYPFATIKTNILNNTGVTAGSYTYTNITVDADGRITAASNGVSGLDVGVTSIANGVAGRVLFQGAGNVLQQANGFFYDQTNSRWGYGTEAPSSKIHIHTLNTDTTSVFKITNPSVTLLNVLANGSIRAGNSSNGNLNISDGASNLGTSNTVYGVTSFGSNVSGEGNTVFGHYSMATNVSGSDHTAIGRATLYSLVSGINCIAIGSSAMRDSVTASNGVAIGIQALYNVNGIYNVSIGNFSSKALTTGEHNTVIGSTAMQYATTSSLCVAIGSNVLTHLIAGGHRNTSIGADSGANVVNGNYNTFIGWGAGTTVSSSALNGSMAIGANSNVITNNTLAFGGIGGDAAIYNVYFGEGERGTNSTSVKLSPSYQEGLNVIGGNLSLTGGVATGNANGGYIDLQTSNAGASGSTLQSLTTKVRITKSGDILVLNNANGLIQLDTTNGNYYRLSIVSGVLTTVNLGPTLPN